MEKGEITVSISLQRIKLTTALITLVSHSTSFLTHHASSDLDVEASHSASNRAASEYGSSNGIPLEDCDYLSLHNFYEQLLRSGKESQSRLDAVRELLRKQLREDAASRNHGKCIIAAFSLFRPNRISIPQHGSH